MGITHARVELAVIEQTRGSVTESFTRRGGELFHGNQLLQKKVSNYDAETTFGHQPTPSATFGWYWMVLRVQRRQLGLNDSSRSICYWMR